MKRLSYTIAGLMLIALISSCNTNSKKSSWTEEQEKQWKKECAELLIDNGNSEPDAEDFCDCFFEKTAKKYTPEEAKNLSEEQERELWDECDYSW